MSNRLSWFFDLHGPSMTLDTACSSSLVALHQACTTLLASNNDCRQAIVAGTNLVLIPDQMTTMNPLHFLSADSQCFSFDERANGYVRGEGVGVLVLKHMDDAIRDNDCIRAVIRSTGVNQDGRTPGITVPSAKAQGTLIEAVYRTAGLNPDDTAYFEAHGTGTAVGDPIEIAGIARVFDRSGPGANPLIVGSVKPNVGHLESAAGMAGIIKAILSLERGVIPPNLNFVNPNPKLLLKERNFKIPLEPTPWPDEGPRRASVNCFGYGGTNAHCIIDDAFHYLAARGVQGRTCKYIAKAPLDRPPSPEHSDSGISVSTDSNPSKMALVSKQRLFVLSAPDQTALSRLAAQHSQFLADQSDQNNELAESVLHALAFTYSDRRSAFKWRSSFVAESLAGLVEELEQKMPATQAGKSPGILFCFTGQGAQWYGMGRELLSHDVYLQSVKAADAHLLDIAGWSVLEELQRSEDESNINKPEFSQTLCTVVQVALVDLLRHWTIHPSTVVGHSSGEIATAYSLGALSARDCWTIAYHRGRLAGQIKTIAPSLSGGMMAVGLSAEEVEPYISKLDVPADSLTVACINSPSSVTVSGDAEALVLLETDLKIAGVFARRLKVENAYHSSHMACVVDQYREAISDVQSTDAVAVPGAAACTMISSVTGRPVNAKDLGPDYWVENMVRPVLFATAFEAAFPAKGVRRRRGGPAPVSIVLEIGPHGALEGPIKQTLASLKKADDVTYTTILSRGKPSVRTALATAGLCWARGVSVDVSKVNSPSQESTIPLVPLANLPKYPWNHRKRYWHESQLNTCVRFRHAPRTDLLGEPVLGFSWTEPIWKNNIRISEQPWVQDHALGGQVLYPAAGMICAAIEAIQHVANPSRKIRTIELRDVIIARALVIPSSDSGVKVLTKMRPQRLGTKGDSLTWFEWNFTSLDESSGKSGNYLEHASGLIAIVYETEDDSDKISKDRLDAQDRQDHNDALTKFTGGVSSEDHYESTTSAGFEYGPMFRGFKSAKYADGKVTFVLATTDTKSVMPENFEFPFLLHPTTLDAVLQGAFQAGGRDRGVLPKAMVPTGFKKISVSSQIPTAPNSELVGIATATQTGLRNLEAHIKISTEGWPETLLEIEKFNLTGVGERSSSTEDQLLSALRRVGSKTVWKPAVDLVEPDHVQRICDQDLSTPEEIAKATPLIARSAAIWIKRTMELMIPDVEAQVSGHFTHLYAWLKERFQVIQDQKNPYQLSAGQSQNWLTSSFEDDEAVLQAYQEFSPVDAKLLGAVGRNLSDILSGKADAMSIMLEDNMLIQMYTQAYGLKSSLTMFKHWFDLQSHKNPNMSVLEIGAGTGSATFPILETIGGSDGKTPRLGSYCYTDISPAFFSDATALLEPWLEFLDFKRLDIERDPVEQGFAAESFDILAASNVLHATKCIDDTLAHCFKLLKPGGTLVIGELTFSLDHTGIIFGTLPGWWLSNDGRIGGPLLSREQWAAKLQKAGFQFLSESPAMTDIDGNALLSLMLAKKPNSPPESLLKVVLVTPPIQNSTCDAIVNDLQSHYSAIGISNIVIPFDEVDECARKGQLNGAGTAVISLVESFDSVFARCSATELESIRSMITLSNQLFWVNCTVTRDGVRHPDSCAISGLFRSVRAENNRLTPVEMHLTARSIGESQVTAQLIARIAQNAWDASDDNEYENEIVEIDGMFHVPRIMDDKSMDKVIQSLSQEIPPEPQPLLQPGRPLKLEIGEVGQIGSLHFVEDLDAQKPLGASEVEIEVKANGVGRR